MNITVHTPLVFPWPKLPLVNFINQWRQRRKEDRQRLREMGKHDAEAQLDALCSRMEALESCGGQGILASDDATDAASPRLYRTEGPYLLGFREGCQEFFGGRRFSCRRTGPADNSAIHTEICVDCR